MIYTHMYTIFVQVLVIAYSNWIIFIWIIAAVHVIAFFEFALVNAK